MDPRATEAVRLRYDAAGRAAVAAAAARLGFLPVAAERAATFR